MKSGWRIAAAVRMAAKGAVPSRGATGGFSLIETQMALVLLGLFSAAMVQAIVLAQRSSMVSHRMTMAAAAAREKLEQLRSLAFGYDEAGIAVTDEAADLTTFPEAAGGGAGLHPSPADALWVSAPGYHDFLASDGRLLGSGGPPPAGSAYIRRWSIQSLDGAPGAALMLQVRVANAAAETRRGLADVTLTTIRVRWRP